MSLKFGKSERLKSKKTIEDVYSHGQQIKKFPFLLKYLRTSIEKGAKVQIVVSIPKRNVKKATDRNRLKRQIKEVYRLNKKELFELINKQEKDLALFLIYTGGVDVEYQLLESKLKLILQELIKQES